MAALRRQVRWRQMRAADVYWTGNQDVADEHETERRASGVSLLSEIVEVECGHCREFLVAVYVERRELLRSHLGRSRSYTSGCASRRSLRGSKRVPRKSSPHRWWTKATHGLCQPSLPPEPELHAARDGSPDGCRRWNRWWRFRVGGGGRELHRRERVRPGYGRTRWHRW